MPRTIREYRVAWEYALADARVLRDENEALRKVAEAARSAVAAHDERLTDMDWTAVVVDLPLRHALADLDESGTSG